MAIKQIVPIFLTLLGDNATTTFTFPIQNMYQQGFGGSVPFGITGSIPSSVTVNNPPFAVTSATIDANGNITITFTTAPPASTFVIELDVTYNSGSATSSTPTVSQNVTLTGLSTVSISGTVPVTQSTSPWVVSLTSTTITGTVAVTQSTSPWVNNMTQWASTVLGTPTAFGTTPGAVVAGSVNSSLFIGTTAAVAAAAGVQKVGIVGNTGATVDASSAQNQTSPTNMLLVGAEFNTAPTTITSGNVSPLQLDSSGNLRVAGTFSSGALADVVGTLAALNALNTTATVNAAGYATIGVFIASGTLAGTVVAEVSYDGGTTWVATSFDDPVTGNKTATLVFTNPNAATSRHIVGSGGASNYRVRVSAFTSGTANATLRASTIYDPSVLFTGAAGSALPADIVQIGGSVTTAAPAYTTATMNALSLTTGGGLRVDGSGVTQPVSGTVTANQGTSPWVVSLTSTTITGTVAVTQSTSPWVVNATQWASTVLGTPQTFGTAPTGIVIGTSSDIYIAGTRARSNQTTTAAGVMDVNIVGVLGSTMSATHPAFTSITDGTNGPAAVKPASTAAVAADASLVVQLSPNQPALTVPFNVSVVGGTLATYRASSGTLAGVVFTPSMIPVLGILFQLRGSATKTVSLTRFEINGSGASIGNLDCGMQRRSTAVTGGTVVTPLIGKADTTDAAATAVATYYTAAPTAGTFVANYASQKLFLQAAPTVIPGVVVFDFGNYPGTKTFALRGTSDYMTISLAGTLPATPILDFFVEWTEY